MSNVVIAQKAWEYICKHEKNKTTSKYNTKLPSQAKKQQHNNNKKNLYILILYIYHIDYMYSIILYIDLFYSFV